MSTSTIEIGMNGRLFPNNWRPFIEEIKFAKQNNFQAIQLSVRDRLIDRQFLGDELDTVAKIAAKHKIKVTIELLIGVDANGRTSDGQSPLNVLKSNLEAIKILGSNYVHWHLVPIGITLSTQTELICKLEESLVSQFNDAVELGQKHHFEFGFEHNEPDLMLFAVPENCHKLLEAVPGLKFVWDINHTIPEHLSNIRPLIAEASLIHVSDTVWPEVNYHLPLGKGNLDFNQISEILIENKFTGPAIFEIGGLKKSGGYGRDTNEALIESHSIFQNAINLSVASMNQK